MKISRRVFYLFATLICIVCILLSRYWLSPQRTLENMRQSFLEGTSPPRPLHLTSLTVTGQESFERYKKHKQE